MASIDLREEISALLAGKVDGVSYKELYSGILSSSVEVAREINLMSNDGLLVRVGAGKTARYYDSKVVGSVDVVPKKALVEKAVEKIVFAPSTLTQRWPVIQKGSAKAQIIWIARESVYALSLKLLMTRLETECDKAGVKAKVSRSALAVYCHTLMKEGFLERVGRGTYKYVGPKSPFDSSDTPIFGNESPERRVEFHEVVEEPVEHDVSGLLLAVEQIESKLGQLCSELKNVSQRIRQLA